MGVSVRLTPLCLAILFAQFAFGAPQLRLSQTALGPIGVAVGANATSATVDAVNAGDGTLKLQVSSSASWLVPAIGPVRDCPLRTQGCYPIEMTLRTAALTKGMYTGVVTVSDPTAVDAPQTITVTVAVGGSVPDRADFILPPNGSSSDLRFNSSALLQTAVSNNTPWLAIGTDGVGSIRAGATVPYRITATHTPGLAEGSYTGQIVTSGSPMATENKTIPVTLRITSAPIAQLSAERLTFRIAAGSAKQTQYVVVGNRGSGTLSVSGVTAATTSGGGWLAANRVEGQNVVAVAADPANVSPGVYQGTVTIASNAAGADISVPVQFEVVAAGPPRASFNGLVNNATFEGGDVVAQGAIVALFGEQFTTGDATVATSLPLADQLASTRVLVNDKPAPVYYLSYNQINFQIPYDATPGDAVIRVERAGQRGNGVSARIVRSAPRLLRLGIGEYGIAVNQDGSFPIPPAAGIASHPAHPGDTLVFYAIGLGPTTPVVPGGVASPSSPLASSSPQLVTFGGTGPFGTQSVDAVPLFAGLSPGFVGLYQVNVTIPADAPRGTAIPVALVGEGGSSNRVTIAIE